MTLSGALVLSVEDEESDGIILSHAFKKAGLPNPLTILGDGQEAVDYLSGTAPYQNRRDNPLPGLMLLDLKMPRMNGFELLAWIAERPELKTFPVVVLTSSGSEADVQRAKTLGARDYLVKPNDLQQYVKLVEDVHARWLKSAPGGT